MPLDHHRKSSSRAHTCDEDAPDLATDICRCHIHPSIKVTLACTHSNFSPTMTLNSSTCWLWPLRWRLGSRRSRDCLTSYSALDCMHQRQAGSCSCRWVGWALICVSGLRDSTTPLLHVKPACGPLCQSSICFVYG